MVYHIVRESDGVEIGLADNIVYIEYNTTGDLTMSTESNAIGIAYMGVPYNLVGHSNIEGADTVHIVKDEISSIMAGLASYNELAAAIREGVNNVD